MYSNEKSSNKSEYWLFFERSPFARSGRSREVLSSVILNLIQNLFSSRQATFSFMNVTSSNNN
jgi:hypothetical protein